MWCVSTEEDDFFVEISHLILTRQTPYGDQLLRIEKGQDGKVAKRASLAEVRYGDLIVPSEAEVREANIQMESRTYPLVSHGMESVHLFLSH